MLRETLTLIASLLCLMVVFGAVGAGAGWIVERAAGPPRGYGTAAAIGAAAGVLLASLVLLSLRSPKGVEMAVSTLVACAVAGLIGYRFLQSRGWPGWKFGLAVFGGGFGGLAVLLVVVMVPMVLANNAGGGDAENSGNKGAA